jgi:COMPASS component SWD1
MTVLAPDPKLPREVVVTPLHKFLDLINRTTWNGVGFSGDGDFVIGGRSHRSSLALSYP